MIRVVDALGAEVALPRPARRVVSLVPSVTETLFALGRGEAVVGRTGYCIHPAAEVASVAVVGGTKDPDPVRIAALAPDLVLANKEENRREDVERLRAVAPVHVSYPRDAAGLLGYLDELGLLLDATAAARRLTAAIETERRRAAEERAAGRLPPLRVVYLIWRKPWMAAGADTFIDALLTETGFVNACAESAADRALGRYPAFDLATCRARGVEAILLSSEPYPFTERHREEVAAEAGLPLASVATISGEAFSWFGVRTPEAFAEARRVRALRAAP
jgi:ABC-type Fe3+-hydroxamate transport system substrate-binding protein